ncbi:MAG TPA: hypothetical protein VGH28_06575 [Polyangiaceae bacterium]
MLHEQIDFAAADVEISLEHAIAARDEVLFGGALRVASEVGACFQRIAGPAQF